MTQTHTNMTYPKKVVCLVALLVTCHLLIVTAIPAGATSRPTSADASELSEASAYLGSMNATRAAHGLGRLSMSGTLNAGAIAHAERMAASGSLFHASDIAAQCSRIGQWSRCAENVGYNTYSSNSVAVAARDFMNSAVHRTNILTAEFNVVGIGVEHSGGNFWIAVRFVATPGGVTAAAAQSTPAQTPATQPRVRTRTVRTTAVPTTTAAPVVKPKPKPKPIPPMSPMKAMQSVDADAMSYFDLFLQSDDMEFKAVFQKNETHSLIGSLTGVPDKYKTMIMEKSRCVTDHSEFVPEEKTEERDYHFETKAMASTTKPVPYKH